MEAGGSEGIAMGMIPRHRIEIEFSSFVKALLFSREEKIDAFRHALEGYFGRNIIFFQSARGAFYSLLKALPQKTIVLPGYTCKVIPEAGLLAGKEIVYVDIDLHTFNVDVKDLKRKVCPQSVIVATHQFGIPCDVEEMADLAKRSDGVLIEDCAGAFGSRWKDQLVGTFGLAAIFSFEFTKVLSAGWGGFLLFNDEALREQVRELSEKELARPRKRFVARILLNVFLHKVITSPFLYPLFIRSFYRRYGFSMDRGEIAPEKTELHSSRLSPVEAALGLSNLNRVQRIIERRQEIARRYLSDLSGADGLGLPRLDPRCFPSLMRFPVRVLNQSKKTFYEGCLREGLDLGFSFNYSCTEACPNATLAAQQVVNLPLNSHLTEGEIDRIIHIVKRVSSSK